MLNTNIAINVKTELLAPAGNKEKLRVALLYGADAVYLGGSLFGLRSGAGNFNLSDIRLAIDFAHSLNKKVYVTLNIYPLRSQLEGIKRYILLLKDLSVDGLIVSDIYVAGLIKKYTDIPIHISTQTSVTNRYTADFWREAGIRRVTLARETSLDEAVEIRKKSGLEVEIFIHGAMCMSYSGKCAISNYIAKRDANRGGCNNACRFDYSFYDKKNDKYEDSSVYLLNSKDLYSIRHIPAIIDGNIDSVKIEGRMKSNLYVANVVKTYREAIDTYLDGTDYDNKTDYWIEQLLNHPNRNLTEAFYNNEYISSSVLRDSSKYQAYYEYIGIVTEVVKNKHIAIKVKNPFSIGDVIEIIPFKGRAVEIIPHNIIDISSKNVSKIIPNSIIIIEYVDGIDKYNVVRKKNEDDKVFT